MTTGRPYRTIGRVLTPIEAIVELRRHSLTQFDPVVVRTFANMELGREQMAS
jgi:HD-GYP domain-containing protein (c-di-GMP phosphodiesterase class II)